MTANAWLQTAAGKRMPLDATVVIGRNPDCEIRLQDKSASRHHAVIHHSRKSGDWIAGLSATNEVRINGAAIAGPARLHNGDCIELGRQKFNYRLDSKARTRRVPERAPSPSISPRLDAPGSTSDGVILIGECRRLLFISRNAMLSLKTYFPIPTNDGLPPAVTEWLDNNLSRKARFPLLAFLRNARLELTVVEDTANHCLIFTRESEPISDAAIAVRLGISPREGEVMLWVAAGKTNPEIAVILAIALRTVVHHLENIFRKLGLENRHAAICLVLGFSDFRSR